MREYLRTPAQREYHREYQQAHPRTPLERKIIRLKHYHRMTPEQWMKFWREQQGCCYLCDEPMNPLAAVVEHDHSCCGPKYSCPECWRGLACKRCNLILGWAQDDPELLRQIAIRLEEKQ